MKNKLSKKIVAMIVSVLVLFTMIPFVVSPVFAFDAVQAEEPAFVSGPAITAALLGDVVVEATPLSNQKIKEVTYYDKNPDPIQQKQR